MQLIKNPRFIEEYNYFNNKINQINDSKIKSECVQLLNQLINEVKAIDRQHEDLVLATKLPSAIDDHKNNLISLRRKINQKIQDCESANLIKSTQSS
jgi:hypothetical protein